MTIFLVLAVYLVLLQISIPESKKMKKSICAAVGFVIVLALRSPYCGVDVMGFGESGAQTLSYAGTFSRMSDFSFSDIIFNKGSVNRHMELGWLLLTKFISLFTHDIQVFLGIIAILQFIPVGYLIGKYSRNVVLSYIIFGCIGFYVLYFSGLRQALAISFLMLAFDQLYQKRYGWFVFITLLASSLHQSALLFLVMWPLSLINLTSTAALVFVVIMGALMPFYQKFIPILMVLFNATRYNGYIENGGQAITMFLVYSVFLLISFLNRSRDRLINMLRVFILVGVVGQSLGSLSAGAITRIGSYFNVYLILLLPETVISFKKNDRVIVNCVSVILLCVFFVLTTPEGLTSLNVNPYSFFWESPE